MKKLILLSIYLFSYMQASNNAIGFGLDFNGKHKMTDITLDDDNYGNENLDVDMGLFPFEIPCELGDVNGDSQINIFDIIGVVNFILNTPVEDFSEYCADVNNDDMLNVFDIIVIINIIMG